MAMGSFCAFFFADTARRAATNCFLAQNCQTTGTATEQVLKAQNVKDGKYHAIKCMKNHFDSIDQVRRQSGLTCFSGCYVSQANALAIARSEENQQTAGQTPALGHSSPRLMLAQGV
jgi:hypothetical protein